ncbi:hypothetical protein TNCV_189071 [Trichonephila clavipes]|nr:hypothetical protein TNCV_189071 [Trichonephila clavipes]
MPSPADRTLKVVIKGLPFTSIEDIKTDLTEQGLTLANVTNSDQQRTAPVDKTEPAKKKSKPVSVINQGEATSGFISAMSEFRKFQSFSGLIEAGKALKCKRPQGKIRHLFWCHGFSRKPPPHTPQ